jgi:hypothetical protein
MNVSDVTPTRDFGVQKEHTYDGVMTSFVAVGNGRTVCISQIEDQPLYIDVYGFEANSVEDVRGRTSGKFTQLAQAMPSGDALLRMAADFLVG